MLDFILKEMAADRIHGLVLHQGQEIARVLRVTVRDIETVVGRNQMLVQFNSIEIGNRKKMN